MACRNGYHHQLHVCAVSLVLLLIAIVDGATYSQDVAYSLRAQSSFSRSYTADSHSTDNPCEKLSILHEIPLQSMMFFYTVINEVPFFMNTGGQIVVTLPSQVEYNAVLLQSYVKTFMLAFPTSIVEDNALQKTPDNDGNATREVVMDNSPSSSPNPSVMPTPQENDDNTQHIGTSVADTSSSSFSSSSGDTILNRYTTFFYFNRPRLSCLYNAPPIMKSLGLLPAGTFDSPIPMAILNKSAIVSNATFMQGCSSHIPPEQQLMPPSTDVLLTRSYMEMELDLQLKIFQYDVWEAMTSNAPRYSAQPSGSMSSSPDTVDGLIEENTHYGTYNLNRDPAKVCSAPAVYSMDLSPLYRVSTRGDSNTLGSNAVGPNVNITHLYPPALFVAVLVQCSSQPVAVDVRVVFSNPSGLGSAEFHLASMLYFVSLAAYILFAILFLFAIIPCWRISFTSPPAKDSAPTSDDRSSTTGRKGGSTPKRSASNGRRSSGRRSGRRRHAQRSQSMSDAKKNSSVRYRSQNSSRDSPREELEADADDAHLAMPRSSHRHTPKTPSDIQHAVELEKRGKQPSPGGRSYSAPPSTRRTTLTSDCTSSGSDSDVSSNYRRRPTDGSNVGEMDESVARNIFPLFYTAVTRWWNPENVVIFVYPSLQWMLLSVMPFKIIVLVLRAAMFFYLSRDADTGFAYGLPTAAVVLMIYTSTFGFVMELLVGMGWGMAFKTLSTYKIVLVAISTTAMFILNVLSSTCGEGTISRIFIFVINPAISSQVGPRCVSLNIARGALLLFFYIHNVIQMILTVRALATHATNPAPSAEIRTSPLGYDKLFLRHVALPTDGQESETLRLQRTDSDYSNIDGQADTQRSRSRRERADLDDPRSGSRASAKKATTSADKYLDPSSPEYATHTRHERASTASKFSADEIQIVIMDLHLRYHGLRFAFAGLPLLMLFYFTLALTMYEVQDYYMEVAFMELLQLYFFSLLLLFFRKEAFYC